MDNGQTDVQRIGSTASNCASVSQTPCGFAAVQHAAAPQLS
jgi:hypothetical protein